MKISVDTKEDSHDDIKKAIRLLQNIIGESAETFTNQPAAAEQNTANAFANMFGNASGEQPAQPSSQPQEEEKAEASESTEDLFAELFSGEELEKMKHTEAAEKEEEPHPKKHDVEIY